MTNMSQFSDKIGFVESSSIFDVTDIQQTFISVRMTIEGDPVRTLFNQTLLLWGRRGLHSSQNTVFKQSRRYRDLRVSTAGQTWTFMGTLFILDNIPFLQDKHTCESSLREPSSKNDIFKYTCAIYRHDTLKSNKTPEASSAMRALQRALVSV